MKFSANGMLLIAPKYNYIGTYLIVQYVFIMYSCSLKMFILKIALNGMQFKLGTVQS